MLSGPEGDPYECLIKPTLAQLLKENVFVRFIHFDVAHRRASCWIDTVSNMFLEMSQRVHVNSSSKPPQAISEPPPMQVSECSGSKKDKSASATSRKSRSGKKTGTEGPKQKKKKSTAGRRKSKTD